MKALIILLGLFTFIPFSSNDESFLLVKTKIENSLVKIKTYARRRGQGSGTFFRIKKQDYVLTNAHVCLSGELDNALTGNIKSKTFKYAISSKNYELDAFIPLEDLIFDLEEDWCLIPMYSKVPMPIIDQTFISEEISGWVRYLTYNRQETPEKFDVFKACSLNNEQEISLKDCRKPLFPKYNERQSFVASDNKTEKTMTLFEGYSYYLPVIAGDSGSPVFNKDNKFIGLITARGSLQKEVPELATLEIRYGVVTPIQGFKDGAR